MTTAPMKKSTLGRILQSLMDAGFQKPHIFMFFHFLTLAALKPRAGNLPDKALMIDVHGGGVFTRYLSAHVYKEPWRVRPRRSRKITGHRGITARKGMRHGARFGRKTKP